LPTRRISLPSEEFECAVGDGDALVGLASTPERWKPGDPAAILVHGLSGCAEAPYVLRVAALLYDRGVRVVRMNLRGAGRGFGKSRGVYHAGRSEDVRRIAEWTAATSPGSPIGLVGFSLGGNLALKLAAEAATHPAPGLDCVIAVNPPIDLAESCRYIQRPSGRVYDRNFVKLLTADVQRLHRRFPELGPVNLPPGLSLYDFDERYTAPRNGFKGADDYYQRSSAGPLIRGIRLPGLVVHAMDDPFIPADAFRRITFPENLTLELTAGGGHLGYLSRTPWRGSRRWLDQRITAWLASRWSGTLNPARVERTGHSGRDTPSDASLTPPSRQRQA
jgi:predicted alpha/beta-fold hydrolase